LSHNNSNNNDLHKENKTRDSIDSDKPQSKLLIVDDDPDIVYVLKVGLLRNRFLVDAFTNPQEALHSFKSNAKSYCLVVSDIRMPALSGIQLAKKIKEIKPDVKVVLMTAFEIRENEFSKVFPSTNVDGFLQKPFTIRDLTSKVLSLIGDTERKRK
jgi:two-component system cell cycle sensor histidine kinase/response regulator CckA